ncbi:MAG: transcription-repair coupling factor [Ruminococcaceae bacterium]|nr:transcription-repair coupling factor [Oscillospiraceae bacterium]
MQFLINTISKIPSIQSVLTTVTGEGASPVAVFGMPDTARSVFSVVAQGSLNKPIFVITDTEATARKMVADAISSGASAEVFPARDFNLLNMLGSSKEYELARISTLWRFITGETRIIFTDIEAFSQKTISPNALKSAAQKISVGDTVDIKQLSESLVNMGYDFTEQVDGMGQFSVRGGIIDIFSAGTQNPVRIELWGDEVDSMAYFDPTDQRRGDACDEFTLLPAAEFTVDNNELVDILTNILQKKSFKSKSFEASVSRDIDEIKSGSSVNVDRYMDFLPNPAVFLSDYAKNSVLILSENRNISSRLKALEESRLAALEDLFENGVIDSGINSFYFGRAEFSEIISKIPTIYVDSFTGSSYPVAPKQVHTVFAKQLSPWGGSMDVLLDDIKPAIKRKQTVVILSGGEKGTDILISQLENNGIHATKALHDDIIAGVGVFVMPLTLSAGLEFSEQNLLVIAHKPLNLAAKKNKNRKKGEAFNSLEELKVGDYVVHFAHGIGQFDGIHRIETGNVVKDYIKIKYKGTDVLYVPVTQLDLVSRYIGSSDENGPILHRLGGQEWQKAKARVRAAVKDMAKELIKLYGERLKVLGHAFAPDSELQLDFEARFPYEETEDQLTAINEIKSDMERAVPMDRLLCGDVGFGKTEVALRAAFKCVCEGKQCAILVPTTILAWQHYLTATERFGELPVKIEMLSRFRTKKQIEKAIDGMARGDVDLVIGTHRMISADVRFRDLGLVIIDEEQRFGVAQKEKLKTMFKAVDVLTLTATPIPRTLNMAMSGIRDMSSIEEAPMDRQPVQTYVLEQNNGILIEAINKELRRGGQVYYLHNRVESIAHCAARLKTALPDANIGLAHGKMSEEELSKVWKSLLEGEIDVLVCTTIIETGVDVPNCNTLIIEDADKMGLAQLHQIRGRVGRSSRRAYAYFCFKRGKALSEIATKRLEAIREYTEFGSGFKIAMRDLEIRGAGNILGGEQHGHMETVGYDMYIKLLGEAISEEKGEEKPKTEECSVDLDISANIPESYIPSLSHRLSIYRRIADIKTLDDKSDVIDELCDRFGDPPPEVLGLMDVALLKGAAGRNGIYEISGDKSEINFYVKNFTPETASELIKKFGQGTLLVPTEPIHFTIKLKPGQSTISILKNLAERL